MTPQQRQLLDAARKNGGKITKKQAVDLQQHQYYANAEKYVGERLTKMVKAGLFARSKPGVYELSDGAKQAVAVKQLGLF